MWVCSPRTVVSNLVYVKDVPKESFGLSRVVNLPGITVTVQQILDALEVVGGKDVLGRVREERDLKIEAIVGSWPARFDVSKAEKLSMKRDVPVVDTVKAFAESLAL